MLCPLHMSPSEELATSMHGLKNSYAYRESSLFSSAASSPRSPSHTAQHLVDSLTRLKEEICEEISVAMTQSQVKSDSNAADLAALLFESFCCTLEGSAISSSVDRLSARVSCLEERIRELSLAPRAVHMYRIDSAFFGGISAGEREFPTAAAMAHFIKENVEASICQELGRIEGLAFLNLQDCYNYFRNRRTSSTRTVEHATAEQGSDFEVVERRLALEALADHTEIAHSSFLLQEVSALRRQLEFVREQLDQGQRFVETLVQSVNQTSASSSQARLLFLEQKLQAEEEDLEKLRLERSSDQELIEVLKEQLDAANLEKNRVERHASEMKDATRRSQDDYVAMLEQQISKMHETDIQRTEEFSLACKAEQNRVQCYKQSCQCYSQIVKAQESRIKATAGVTADEVLAASLRDCAVLQRRLQETVEEINGDLKVNDL